MSDTHDIVATAIAAGNFTTLVTAVTKANLVDTLKGAGPFTVFAPTDEAFAKVPKATLDGLLADPEKLKAVLLYHVVPGKVAAADVLKLHDGAEVKTVNGKSFKLHLSGSTVKVDGATVVKTDIACSNGYIHVIDQVILPS